MSASTIAPPSAPTPIASAPIPADSLAIWIAAKSGDESARDTLIRENLSLVHHVAQQLARSLATDTDLDELISAGSMGLMKAVAEFDAGRGLAFSTYAVPKIRGAILDELRRLDHVPRSVRRKARDMGTAKETLSRQLGRLPTDDELAAHLGVDKLTLWRMQSDVEAAVQIPIDRASRDRNDPRATGMSAWEIIPSNEEESIEDLVDEQQQKALIRDALMLLDEQSRTVLALYYFEDLKLHEIGEVLGLTESRVSQIRTGAIATLGKLLEKSRGAF